MTKRTDLWEIPGVYPRFGTAGAGDLFYEKGYKRSEDVPHFLREMGLTAFEYQCGRGVRISREKAEALGENAKKYDVALSVHAPYYISLSTTEKSKQEGNLRYFLESARAAQAMGATRVVFHPGGAGKVSREKAFALARETLSFIMGELHREGFSHILFCPETMGMINQLGDLAETIELCKLRENMLPCVDFGHMNSRTKGQMNSFSAFDGLFSVIENELGQDRAKNLHCHFSKIEYGAGGEKRHLTFADDVFGPDYEPLMELLYKKGYTPTVICESAGTQAEDAKAMSEYYFKTLKK